MKLTSSVPVGRSGRVAAQMFTVIVTVYSYSDSGERCHELYDAVYKGRLSAECHHICVYELL